MTLLSKALPVIRMGRTDKPPIRQPARSLIHFHKMKTAIQSSLYDSAWLFLLGEFLFAVFFKPTLLRILLVNILLYHHPNALKIIVLFVYQKSYPA